MDGPSILAGDTVVLPYLVTLLGEEGLAADVVFVHDPEGSLGVEAGNVTLVIPLHRECLLLQCDHLLKEPIDTFLPHVALIIALEFEDESDHHDAHRARRLRLMVVGFVPALRVVEVRLLDQRLEVGIYHKGDTISEPMPPLHTMYISVQV